MFNPAGFQDLNVYFDLTLGGLSKIYHLPNTPVEMEVRYSRNSAPQVKMALFDEAAAEVEPYIWQSRDPDTGIAGGTLQWGYQGDANVSSEPQNFQLYNYKPSIVNRAFMINMYGFITTMTPMMSSNQMSGTITEILNQFSKTHNLDLTINPPFDPSKMQDTGTCNRNTTELQEMKHLKQMSQPDWTYINQILRFARDSQGQTGYHAVLDCVGGKNVIKVVKTSNAQADYTYTVFEKDTVVHSWEPDITFAAIFDQSDTQFNGYDRRTGDTTKNAMSHAVTKPFANTMNYDVTQTAKSQPTNPDPSQIGFRCSENMPDAVVNGAIRSRAVSARSMFSGGLPLLYSHIQGWSGQNKAALVIEGDPAIRVLSQQNALATCDVTFCLPVNYFNTTPNIKHYTSGLWQVTDVIHRISMGKYTTTILLERFGHPELPQPLPAQGESQ